MAGRYINQKKHLLDTQSRDRGKSVQDGTLPQALIMRSADISAHIRDTDQSYHVLPLYTFCLHSIEVIIHATAFLMQNDEPCHPLHRRLRFTNAARPKSGERCTCQSRFDRPNSVHLPHESRLIRVEHMAIAANCLYDPQLEHDLDRVQTSTFQTVGLCG